MAMEKKNYIAGAKKQQEIDEEELKSKWISVDDMLPEECADVLLLDEPMNYYHIGHLCYGEWSCDGYTYDKDYFTHWMPLPEPPKTK